jgi:hypothetical protein
MPTALAGAALLGYQMQRRATNSAKSPGPPRTRRKLLAKGLTALTEALRELDDRLGKVEQHVCSSTGV